MARKSGFIQKRFIEPAVKSETRILKRELKKISQGTQKKDDSKSLQLQSPTALFANEYISESYNISPSQLLSRYFGWIYTAINAIADELSAIDIELMQLDGEDIKEVVDHPVLQLLSKVNPDMTFSSLLKLTEIHLKLTGEAYWYLYREGSEITQIRPLRPDYIRAIPGDYRLGQFVQGWLYMVPGRGQQTIAPQDLIQFKYPHPESSYKGMGVLEASVRTANLEYSAEEWNNAFFKNAASTGAVFEFPGDLSPETKRRLLASFNQQYTSLRKAHKTIIVDNGGKYTEAGRTQRDMEFSQMNQWTRDKLLAMFRVSKAILGITEDVNRANAETSEYIFGKRVLKPEFSLICDFLNEFLLPQFAGTENMFFDFEDPVPKDESQEATMLSGLVNNVLTINEVRNELGWEPVGPEGDVLYLPVTLNPIGDTSSLPQQQMPNNPTTPMQPVADPNNPNPQDNPQDPNQNTQPVQNGYIVQIPGIRPKKKLSTYAKKQVKRLRSDKRFKQSVMFKERIENVASVAVKALKEVKVKQEQEKAFEYWKAFVDDIEGYVANARQVMKKIFQREEDHVIHLLREANKGGDLTGATFKANFSSVFAYLRRGMFLKKTTMAEFLPIMESCNKAQGKRAAELLASKGFKYLSQSKDYQYTQNMKDILTEHVSKMAGSISDTRAQKLTTILQTAVEDQLSVDDAAREIRSFYKSYTSYEAQRIARTELLRAGNEGSVAAWQQSGVVTGKQWYTAGADACQWCQPMQGKVIELSDAYHEKGTDFVGSQGGVLSLDYESVDEPPLHPNCRCTVLPVLGDVGPLFTDVSAPADNVQARLPNVIGNVPLNSNESKFLADNKVDIVRSNDHPDGLFGEFNHNTNQITVYGGTSKKELKDTFNHELGHAIYFNYPKSLASPDKAIAFDTNEVVLRRIMKDDQLSMTEARSLLTQFQTKGGSSKYIDYVTGKSEVFAEGYRQFKKNAEAFKKYAPKLYSIFKGLF